MTLRNELQSSTNPCKNVLGKDWGKGKEVGGSAVDQEGSGWQRTNRQAELMLGVLLGEDS